MKLYIRLLLTLGLFLSFSYSLLAENNFFEEGKSKYKEKKYEESKFLFQRSIVFNPKNHVSYLYLAKIYKFEENKKEEQKNINSKIVNLFIFLINICSHFLLDQHCAPCSHKNLL